MLLCRYESVQYLLTFVQVLGLRKAAKHRSMKDVRWMDLVGVVFILLGTVAADSPAPNVSRPHSDEKNVLSKM